MNLRPADLPGPPPTSLPVETLRIRVAAATADFPEWPRTDRVGLARCHVFQCADVLDIWLDTIGRARGTRPCFVGVHTGEGQPVMLLALGIERKRVVRVLGFLDGSVSDYCQPVLFPAAAALDAGAVAALWRRIRALLPRYDVALLDKMPAEVGGLPNPLVHLGAEPMPESGHVMSLSGTAEALEARIPVSKRHARYCRELGRRCGIAFEVAQTPEAAERFLGEMIANKTRRFEETRVPGFEVPGKRAFFEEATRRLPNLAPIHLSAVRADDTVIASHWGLVLGERFYFLMTAYADGVWRKYSPGRILNDELIRWCHAQGYAWFDFGIGDESYKYEYCDVTIPLMSAVVPETARGRAYLRGMAVLDRLRASALWQRLRPYKWVLLRRLRRDGPSGADPADAREPGSS